jgi:hypothetical protein
MSVPLVVVSAGGCEWIAALEGVVGVPALLPNNCMRLEPRHAGGP